MRTVTIIVGLIILVVAAAALVFVRSRRFPPDPPVGTIFGSPNEDGTFSVFKVLAVDDSGIHIRIYANRLSEKPKAINENELELKSVYESDYAGVGHLPLSRAAFWRMDHFYIQQSTVSPDELEGYDMFKDADGGVWD